jgi:hypothetical protein
MFTRSRNLLILAGLSLGGSVLAEHVPAVARSYDSHVIMARKGECPFHRAQSAWHAAKAPVSVGASDSIPAPPEGSIFSLGRSAIFAP